MVSVGNFKTLKEKSLLVCIHLSSIHTHYSDPILRGSGMLSKEGIPSFLLDCQMNDDIKEIEAIYGIKGFAIIVRLWQKIYSGKGYYCEWTERSTLLFLANWFGGNCGVDKNLIDEVVKKSIKNGIFNEFMYENYSILTSKRLQKQYFDVAQRRKEIEVIDEYLLISVDNFKCNVNKISISDNKNVKNVDKNATRKGKETEHKETEDITLSKDNVSSTDVQLVGEKWNELESYGVRAITKLNSGTKRYKSLVARINQYGLEKIIQAMEKIKQSDFLCGKNSKGWTITFDWFVLPNNFPKVLEGNYDNNNPSTYLNPCNVPKNVFTNYPQRQYTGEEIEEIIKRKANN